jgi:hypothetical protein
LIFYYYQLFVKANTYGESIFTYDDGTIISLPVRNIQSYNKGLLCNPPYSGWVYPEKAYRDENHNSWPFIFAYSDDMKAFYFTENYPASLFTSWGNAVPGTTGHSSVDTHLLLHAPPAGDTPFILVLKHVATIESLPIYSGWVYSAIANYKFNGCDILPLAAPSCLGRYDSCYVVIDEFTPDEDFYVNVQTPNYGEGFRTAFARVDRFFSIGNITTLTGDILVDSNNDGFLGGEDNAYEMISPGCVFWANDDDDYNESSVHQDDSNPALASGEADCHDNKINGIRDLEDFMPFNITIPDIKEWTNNQNVKFYLKAEGEGKIRVFKRVQDVEKENDLAYLKKLNRSIQQYTEEMKFLLPSDSDTKQEGQLLDPSWFDSDGNFYAIFEGVEKGNLKLTLEVELGEGGSKKRFTLDEMVVTLKDVKSMYKLYNVRYKNDGQTEGTETDNKGVVRYLNIKESGSYFPVNPETIFIWTHGFNSDLSASIQWIEIVFKRLYRTGYRGGFAGISWHGNVNFLEAWPKSYQTSPVVAEIIISIMKAHPDATINIGAHSLGNNVISYAVRLVAQDDQANSKISDIIFMEGAVPAVAYSGISDLSCYRTMTLALNDGNKMLNVNYRDHATPEDMNYEDAFFSDIYGLNAAAISGHIYNTYSKNDEVVYRWYETALYKTGLFTPLDADYNLTNDYVLHDSSFGGLGYHEPYSVYSNFESEGFYHYDVMNWKAVKQRPYGIREHSSMSSEYYYDVKELYEHIVGKLTE